MLPLLFQTVGSLEQDQIVFPRLGLDFNVHSTAFTLFGLTVTWYGVLITVGMLLAMIYGFTRMRKVGLDPDRAIDGVIGGVIGGIIGARLYYIAFHWDSYADDWRSVFNIRSGGLAIYGGIIGALLVGSVICKLRKVRLLPMFDVVSLGFLIGQCIGRWGNFTNHEAFGGNTDGVFGMSSGRIQTWIARNYTDGSVAADRTVHPCFLYESVWCLLGFVLLHFIFKKWRKFDGQIFLMYVIWYGTGRFFIEGLRTDSLYLGTIKISQAVALVSVVTALVLLIVGLSRVRRMGGDYQLYADTAESKALLEEADRKAAEYEAKRSRKKNAILPDEEMTNVLLGQDAAEAVKESAEESVEDAAETVKETAEETVKDAAEAVKETAEETVKDAAEAVKETAEETVKDAAEAVKETAEETVKDAAEAVKETAEETVKDAAETVKKSAEETAKDAAEAVKETAEETVKDAAETVKETAEETVKDAAEAGKETAKNAAGAAKPASSGKKNRKKKK
ncbi:MAG: prolipoprotein diacylglyceryl transferase [Oscillospiraceae bacterium]|nr:prolipoprotein diacylglyceryl transferase [Oscillospiraceae bacterium]